MRYPPEGVAGVANTVEALSEIAVAHGHHVVVAARTPSDQFAIEERNGVRVMRVPAGWSRPEVGEALRVELASFEPNVVNCHLNNGFPAAAVVAGAAAVDAPIVQFLHHYLLICHDGNQRRDGISCTALCDECVPVNTASRSFTDRVSAVVGVSQHIIDRHLARGHFDGLPSLVVPPMVDGPASLLDDEASERMVRAERPGELRFGFIGRVEPEKGIAALSAEAKRRDLLLDVAGDGPAMFVQTLRSAFESDRLRFLGWQDPEAFFGQIDVCVVPSLFEEPFGRVAIEAQANGVPVIASRIGGLGENVVDGETGWLYGPDDPEGLAAALTRAIDGPRIDAAACRAFAEPFRSENVWPRLESFLGRIVSG